MRFMMDYGTGRGDYTEERREFLPALTLDEALAMARRIDEQRG
jgi:hypothetical protein